MIEPTYLFKNPRSDSLDKDTVSIVLNLPIELWYDITDRVIHELLVRYRLIVLLRHPLLPYSMWAGRGKRSCNTQHAGIGANICY